MYLDPSQVYTGNITRLKCNHVLPERLWGTRKGMIQLAAQALDLEFFRRLSLRVRALTKGDRRQEVHPQTMAENQIPTKTRNLEAPVYTNKGTKICGLYASGQENSALLCWICLWGCYYANCWQVILDCLGFVFVFCTLPGIRSSQPGRCMSKVMPKPVCPIQQSQRYSTLWGHGSVHGGGGICLISRMHHCSITADEPCLSSGPALLGMRLCLFTKIFLYKDIVREIGPWISAEKYLSLMLFLIPGKTD